MSLDKESERPAAVQGNHCGDAAHALFAAIAQMGLALRESQDPVADLGGLFAHLAETLSAVRSVPFAETTSDSVSAATVRGFLEQLQSDVFKGIQQLQFYDRMVQHLSHIQEYLIAVANELGSANAERQPQAFWDEIHARLRKRLISDEQRGLLDVFLLPDTATRVSAQAPRPDYSPPGSFELF
jgi:hypothetical protein